MPAPHLSNARSISRRGLLMAAAGLLSFSAASARSLDGLPIRFLVGTEGAGGYEAYARTFVRHLADALPNNRIVVESVPVADGRLAAKQIAEAPAGSLVIGLFETALLYSEIEKDDLAPITLSQFNWLGKMAVDERIVIASRAGGLHTVDDLIRRKSPSVFPSSTVASRSASEAYVLNAMLGTMIKPVPGYNGGQRNLAMISGEGEIVVGSYPNQAPLIDQGAAAAILRLNAVNNGAVSGDVPLLRDRAMGPYQPLVELIELSCNLGRWIAAPPSIESWQLDKLRSAFDRTVASAAFREDAGKQLLSIDVLDGATVQDRVRGLIAKKTELRALLQSALACGRKRAEGVEAC